MSKPPAQPKIYHIVHHDRLASIIDAGCLWPDSHRPSQPRPGTPVGMREIKERRRTLPVTCHKDCRVGDCVPFYFCSRSVMLYLLHRANHPNLEYRGGQEPILHLEADLHRSIEWAEANDRRWAFSLSNAGAYGTEFMASVEQLNELEWEAIASTDFSRSDVRSAKQAEFPMEESFPWALVDRIGVRSPVIARQVADAMQGARHRPVVQVLPDWYY